MHIDEESREIAPRASALIQRMSLASENGRDDLAMEHLLELPNVLAEDWDMPVGQVRDLLWRRLLSDLLAGLEQE